MSLFCIGRLLEGLASGVSSFLVPVYSTRHLVKELTAGNNFGSLGSIHQIMITWGIFTAYLLGVLCYTSDVEKYSWLIAFVPLLISLAEGAFFKFSLTYESPVFLWMSGQKRKVIPPQALEVVNYINNESMPLPQTDDDEEEEEEPTTPTENPSFGEVLTKSLYRRPMFMACGLSLFQQFGGVNVIIMSASKVLEHSSDIHKTWWLVVLVGAANAISALFTLFFIDCEG